MASASLKSAARADDTRHRILVAAAALFAARGFYATSTRAIALRVGVSQPTLFYHFPSKTAILSDLLRRDLVPALDRIIAFRGCPEGAGCRLYAYLYEDTAALVEAPFDARGLYHDEAMLEEELADLRGIRDELRHQVRQLVEEGIASGEFRAVGSVFAGQIITGMMLETIAVAGSGSATDLADRPRLVADFTLLGLLASPESLPQVQDGAARVRVCVAGTIHTP